MRSVSLFFSIKTIVPSVPAPFTEKLFFSLNCLCTFDKSQLSVAYMTSLVLSVVFYTPPILLIPSDNATCPDY